MGSAWSSYAGSTEIASFATLGKDDDAREYDYIVCGGKCTSCPRGLLIFSGGTAGCVIASRVSTDTAQIYAAYDADVTSSLKTQRSLSW